MSDATTSFDGCSGCLTCDRTNVANAVHAVAQLRNCAGNDISSFMEAMALIEREYQRVYPEAGGE